MAKGDRTPGRRVFPEADGRTFAALVPGDYIYFPGEGRLLYWPAWAEIGPWGAHHEKRIEVHDDGTISVSPSILLTYKKRDPSNPRRWHGYLERGVWRED